MPPKQEQKQQSKGQQSNPKGQQSNPKGQQSNPKGQQSNPKGQQTNPDDNKIVQIPLVTLKKFRNVFEVASNRANWRTDELLPVGLIVRDIDMLINHFSNPPSQEKKEEKQNPKV